MRSTENLSFRQTDKLWFAQGVAVGFLLLLHFFMTAQDLRPEYSIRYVSMLLHRERLLEEMSLTKSRYGADEGLQPMRKKLPIK